MRTTIRLNDDLLKQAKQQAAESGLTLTSLIEESLRERLRRGKGLPGKRKSVKLKTAGSGGLLPGIDLDDNASLLDVMEDKR